MKKFILLSIIVFFIVSFSTTIGFPKFLKPKNSDSLLFNCFIKFNDSINNCYKNYNTSRFKFYSVYIFALKKNQFTFSISYFMEYLDIEEVKATHFLELDNEYFLIRYNNENINQKVIDKLFKKFNMKNQQTLENIFPYKSRSLTGSLQAAIYKYKSNILTVDWKPHTGFLPLELLVHEDEYAKQVLDSLKNVRGYKRYIRKNFK